MKNIKSVAGLVVQLWTKSKSSFPGFFFLKAHLILRQLKALCTSGGGYRGRREEEGREGSVI